MVTIFTTYAIISVEARKHHGKKSKPHKHLKDKSDHGNARKVPGPAPTPLPSDGSYPASSTIFDVLSFGAKGDGISDDSQVM